MKEATKRVSSEALAQMLAVVAMAVIASILFFGNSDTRRAKNHRRSAVQYVVELALLDDQFLRWCNVF